MTQIALKKLYESSNEFRDLCAVVSNETGALGKALIPSHVFEIHKVAYAILQLKNKKFEYSSLLKAV